MPISSIEEYTLESTDKKDKGVQEEGELPIYLEHLKLSEEQKDRISKEIQDELEAIKEERDGEKLEAKWDALDNQYDGKVEEDSRRMFNLCRKVTKVKVKRVVNKIMKAFMQSDPKYAVSPRPEFMRQGGQDVADKQSDFLDYKLDNLPFRKPMGQTAHSSVNKGTGFLKVFHLIKREKRKREEAYEGTPGIGKPFQVGIDPTTQQPMMVQNDGLSEFIRNWPDAPKDYPNYIKRLAEGKEIRIVAEYTETTYNDPAFKNINLKNFFARINTDGYEGLKTTRLIGEREDYSYWDLKKEEKKGMFEDIDELIYSDKDKKKLIEKYENKSFSILECVLYTKLKDTDDEEVKIVVWYAEDKKKIIGSIMYPYYAIDCYYIPFYISDEKVGLYGSSLSEDLTDTNIAENAVLNHVLEAAWMRNLITPIVPAGSDIEKQFLGKTWTHGIPLTVNPGEAVDFLQKYMPQVDIGGMMNLIQYLIQGDDDVSGVSSLMSGRESPIDPTAPAQKTMALLSESGENIAEYIMAMSPSFNLVGEILLQLYFQMMTDGIKYRPKPERVVGDNPFSAMSRADVCAKTNIQVQAKAFAFNELENAKKDLALLQVIRNDPFFAQYPESIRLVFKNVIKGWSEKWNNLSEQLLPSKEEFMKKQVQIAAQAVAMFVQEKTKEAKITGVPIEFNPQQLVQAINQAVNETFTPPPHEVQKQREEQASAG